MMTDLLQCTDAIIGLLGNYVIHSTISLAMCAAAVYFANPKSYALRSWLWKSAATLPIATSLATSVLSLNSFQFGYVIDDKLLVVSSAASESANATSIAPRSYAQIEEFANQDLSENVVAEVQSANELKLIPMNMFPATESLFQPDSRLVTQTSTLSSAVFFLLLCCSCWPLAKIVHFLVCYRKLLKFTDECRSGVLHNELVRFLKSNGIRRPVRLLVSDQLSQPFALGLVRWTIAVPRDLEYALDKEQVRALFAHEVGHLVRHDAAWIAIGGFLCSFLAFQPLNFLARRRWLDASEFLADEWAVRSGVTPLRLVRCLASVAEWQATGMLSAAMPFANKSAHALTRRAEHLLRDGALNRNSSSSHHLWASLAVTMTGFMLVLLSPHVGEARETGVNRSLETAQSEIELQAVSHLLREVSLSLNEAYSKSSLLDEVDGLPARLRQFKVRAHSLTDRAETLSKLCKKDLR